MDGSLVIMEGSLLSRFLLFQWIVALSLWKVVFCRDFCYSNGWKPSHYGRLYVVDIFVTTMDGSLVIMEGSLLLRFFIPLDCSLVIMEGSLLLKFLLFHWMVTLSLWKVVYCRYFC